MNLKKYPRSLTITLTATGLVLIFLGTTYAFVKLRDSHANPQNTPTILFVAHTTAEADLPNSTTTVYADGSGTVTFDPQNITRGLTNSSVGKGSLDVTKVEADLAKTDDVSTLPITSDCTKTGAFSRVETITYRGKTSGDLTCSVGGSLGSILLSDDYILTDTIFSPDTSHGLYP